MEKLPTLVTYRSAIDLRDAGIRYAYLKAGMYAGSFVMLCAMAVSAYFLMTGQVPPLTLPFLGIFAVGIAYWCAEKAIFPHTPRLTLEELESMRSDIGLRPDVFKQTHDSVLHGSENEHQAIDKANALLRKVARTARR